MYELRHLVYEDYLRTSRRWIELLVNDNFKLVFWFRIASYLKLRGACGKYCILSHLLSYVTISINWAS